MALTVQVNIGKKYAIYLPKVVVRALNLKEGARILLRVSGTTILLETLQDPIHLALAGKKFASLTPEQIETISQEEQAAHLKSPA